jgi:glycerol-3-phosphate dehydrogenase (NAD(P)+)
MAEITRLGVHMGAEPLTFAGLSGMGDLITTTSSLHSRNRYLGMEIGKGKKPDEVLSEMVMVAEGVKTTRVAKELADTYYIEMPITQKVYEVLYREKNPREALTELMTRSLKSELG